MAPSGARWRDLPQRFGKVSTIKSRYYRWVEDGVFDAILEAFAEDCDTEWVAIDAATVKAHPQAVGAPAKSGARRLAVLAAPVGA